MASVGELTFEAPDTETFACLRLAREAGEAGGTAPCVLNAADEVAVEAFLDRRIPFTGIPEVIERTLEALPGGPVRHFEELFQMDEAARGASSEPDRGTDSRVSWLFVFLGFIA